MQLLIFFVHIAIIAALVEGSFLQREAKIEAPTDKQIEALTAKQSQNSTSNSLATADSIADALSANATHSASVDNTNASVAPPSVNGSVAEVGVAPVTAAESVLYWKPKPVVYSVLMAGPVGAPPWPIVKVYNSNEIREAHEAGAMIMRAEIRPDINAKG